MVYDPSTDPDPWRRIKSPTALPADLTARSLRELANAGTLPALLRDNLLPRHGNDEQRSKVAWHRFWDLVAVDPILGPQTVQILQIFLEQADDELDRLEAAGADQADTRRVRRFGDLTDQMLTHIEARQEQPLAWAGPAAVDFNPEARKVIQQLVTAIADHRERTLSDRDLWATLKTVHLDPGRGLDRLDRKNRRRPSRSPQ